jgi:fructoselysine-6-P-deglycase FrlB-like protein
VSTFIVDGIVVASGKYFSDSGLTAEQVAAAKANAARFGVEILSVTEERDVSVSDLAPFGGMQ